VIINETAAKTIGFKNTIGESVTFRGKKYSIIGIVEDMITQSPYDPPAPSIFFREGWTGFITIRIKPDMLVREALAKVETVFKKYNPSAPFDYQFVDVAFGRKFSDEERIGSLATFFASLAIFISCLGLFGLASFVAEQRTKEIGIRKVLGASVANLWRMLSKDFVKLIFISLLIAIPVAYYFMDQWLQNYEYRVDMSWWVFAASGAGLIIITLLTVSFQAIKAAVANPVRSLRSE
jgi:ABC-type antimicrobial peptide transport system permease subunit